MALKPVLVRKLGEARLGYRVLAAPRKPAGAAQKKMLDAWIPALAPSAGLMKRARGNKIGWRVFKKAYGQELARCATQNLIKPLALLSRRRAVVLLCDCGHPRQCPSQTLAETILKCRKTGNFRMNI